MGNDICSEVSNYCAEREETTMIIYEYPSVQPRSRVKEIQLPGLTE